MFFTRPLLRDFFLSIHQKRGDIRYLHPYHTIPRGRIKKSVRVKRIYVRYGIARYGMVLYTYIFVYKFSAVERGCRPLLVARGLRMPPLPLL